jgi:hypothetical protein
MSNNTLTEQLSLRLTGKQRKYLRGQASELMRGNPPIRVTESDVLRVLIERAIRADVSVCPAEFVDA